MEQGKTVEDKTVEGLTRQRDQCKELLDNAQEELNKRILADSPVKSGDIVEDEDKTIFRVVSVSVKTFYKKDGKLNDRLMIEFQKKSVTEHRTSWQEVNINTTALASRVLSGKAKVVRHARE